MAAVVTYFPIKGLGESIRLTLAAAGVPFENEPVPGSAGMKEDLDTYPFGQCPRFRDGIVDLTQSGAILRHIARTHGLYGSSPAEAAYIDQLLDGMADLKGKLAPLIYADAFQGEDKAAEYWAAHGEAEAATGACKGAHLLYISRLVQKRGKDGWAVGGALSVADTFLFDLIDFHLAKFGADKLTQAYPALMAHHAKIAALPGVAAYLAGPLRHAK